MASAASGLRVRISLKTVFSSVTVSRIRMKPDVCACARVCFFAIACWRYTHADADADADADARAHTQTYIYIYMPPARTPRKPGHRHQVSLGQALRS